MISSHSPVDSLLSFEPRNLVLREETVDDDEDDDEEEEDDKDEDDEDEEEDEDAPTNLRTTAPDIQSDRSSHGI